MEFKPIFSQSEAYSNITRKIVDCVIKGKNGEVIFEQKGVEVPAHWSETAANILAQKYFRKTGIPLSTKLVKEPGIPYWLQKQIQNEDVGFRGETSAYQVFHRLAGCWTYWGWKLGFFDKEYDACTFYNEMIAMLALQIGAPNSPQYFNCGLNWAYGIEGPELTGYYAFDKEGKVFEVKNTYEHPQIAACFLLSIKDDLVNPGGIMDLWLRESRLFKLGSGAGSNFSAIRAKNEKLAGGGVSSGLMSFLRVGDANAGAIKSGGTTRRSARLVCLDLDHPEIEDFIDWKIHEEEKAAAIAVGSRAIKHHLENIYRLVKNDCIEHIDSLINICSTAGIPQSLIDRIIEDAKSEKEFDWKTYSLDWEGEAIQTIGGQNANNSVRIPDQFFTALEENTTWKLTNRVDGEVYKEVKARDLWNQICYAAWACADPGVMFDTTINSWNTCANDGRIETSNPCGEYVALTDTACNLASLNLVKFWNRKKFDVDKYIHAIRLWTTTLEISVGMAAYPSEEIARRSYAYRTLGLGYANLGGLLMRMGLSYDSNVANGIAADLTAILTGQAYRTSVELADIAGPFARFNENRDCMNNVLYKHYDRINGNSKDGNVKSYIPPRDPDYIYLNEAARWLWERVAFQEDKFRNAFVTCIAPTGTISLIMDCDCTGVEPEFSLVRYKSLSGGGTMKFVNQSVSEALYNLDYTTSEVKEIIEYLVKYGTIEGSILKEEHIPIFDCAVASGEGKRSLSPMAHLLMVAAVQPFLSGAVSKTINMPKTSTVENVSFIYQKAWEFGLKSVSIYRDGSKLTQPMTTQEINLDPIDDLLELQEPFKPNKRKLPDKRSGYTQKANIGGYRMYHRTGEYPDGRLGEIFIDLAKEGSTMRSLMNAFAIAISVGLQNGVPLEDYIEEFTHMRFEPAGPVQNHDRIKFASSLLDYLFRDLAINYLGRDDLAHTQSIQQAIDKINNEQDIPIAAINKMITKTGYTGDICDVCGNATMLRSGTCLRCDTCGTTSGCS